MYLKIVIDYKMDIYIANILQIKQEVDVYLFDLV